MKVMHTHVLSTLNLAYPAPEAHHLHTSALCLLIFAGRRLTLLLPSISFITLQTLAGIFPAIVVSKPNSVEPHVPA